MMRFIIIGAPGSGKGTQAELLAKKLRLKHISSNLLRDEIKKKTRLGKIFERYINRGDLVPDKFVNRLFKRNIPKDNFILDGYPRRVGEARYIKSVGIDYIIFLDVPKSILKKRLLRRAKIEGRKDDTEKVIEERFRVYNKETMPLLKYYKNKLIRLDGNRKPEKILKDIIKIIRRN